MSPTTSRERNRKLVLSGVSAVLLIALAWAGLVFLAKGCENPSEVAALAMKAVGAVTVIVAGYLGANVLDKARGLFGSSRAGSETETER